VKHLTLAVFLAACAIVPRAMAQRNELTGILGRTFVSDQGIQGAPAYDSQLRFGKGLTFEVNYARGLMVSPLWSLSAEVPFVVNVDQDLHAAVPNRIPESYKSFFATPAARVNIFPTTAVSPWVSIGGGFAHFSPSSDLLFGGKTPNLSGTTTGALEAGVGLDVRLYKEIRLRGEARDFWTGVPQLNVTTGKDHQHNYLVGVGIVWRFGASSRY
jgi:Outer membrane protein beta-barrel domain